MDEGVHCAGHEGAGTVVAMGADVDPLVWKVGDRAGIKPILTVCQECRFCRSGQETVCDKARYAGAHGNGSYAEVGPSAMEMSLLTLPTSTRSLLRTTRPGSPRESRMNSRARSCAVVQPCTLRSSAREPRRASGSVSPVEEEEWEAWESNTAKVRIFHPPPSLLR